MLFICNENQWKAIFTALEIQQDWVRIVFAFTWMLVSEKNTIDCGDQSSALGSGSDPALASRCETNVGRPADVFMRGFILK